MNILVTGAEGFVGKNLVENLYNIKTGKNRTRDIFIEKIFEFDRGSTDNELKIYCKEADFVFHFAGVNRPNNDSEFMMGNADALSKVLGYLEETGNLCPVMLSSSIQAELTGRFENSAYGCSKLEAEKRLRDYARSNDTDCYIYRFPGIFGKWCKPNYNSVVATFCYNIANGLPIRIDNPRTRLELIYIDDLICEMLDLLEGKPHISAEDERFFEVPQVFETTLERIVTLLQGFHEFPKTCQVPFIGENTFEKALFSTYLSYVPKEKMIYDLPMNIDNRGIFTELIKTESNGQVSINIASPGIIRGEHWHNSKWEIFIVVSGHGLIQERRIGLDEEGKPYPIIEFEVTGEQMKAVTMLPGYTHRIVNLSKTENLVTVMWANEQFDKDNPDTFFESVMINRN